MKLRYILIVFVVLLLFLLQGKLLVCPYLVIFNIPILPLLAYTRVWPIWLYTKWTSARTSFRGDAWDTTCNACFKSSVHSKMRTLLSYWVRVTNIEGSNLWWYLRLMLCLRNLQTMVTHYIDLTFSLLAFLPKRFLVKSRNHWLFLQRYGRV